jgi:chemotaxis protein CheX
MATAPVAGKEIARFEKNLDRAVEEVFSTMIGVACAPMEESPVSAGSGGRLSAVVGLAGAISGSLVVHSGREAAMRIAERMTGMVPEGLDPLVRDAMGEVCNMVAGAWKGFDPQLASGCLLSTPTVIAGASYDLFSQRAAIRIERGYGFENLGLRVTIFCEFAG